MIKDQQATPQLLQPLLAGAHLWPKEHIPPNAYRQKREESEIELKDAILEIFRIND